ncbi:unnamed protein product [Chrysodeixis includens]|uniref:Cuticle protein n=1 Tax=Chrysodeixis includens TaxID=689277 RepID=A0A9P0C6S8_CHRIL|nr:unnamed protein product [Chrysodeixis includens]
MHFSAPPQLHTRLLLFYIKPYSEFNDVNQHIVANNTGKMFSKIVALSALLAAANAGFYDHGYTVSSRSIVHHDEPVHYVAPLADYAASIAHYTPPIVHYAPPVAHHAPPVVHHAPPVVHHAPLVAHHAPSVAHHASAVAHHALQVAHHAATHTDGHDLLVHPEYDFGFAVIDPHTGDHKHGSHDADIVHGYYALVQPDGSIHKVEYSADAHNGFNAVVNNSPSLHPVPAHTHAHGHHY